MTDHDTVTNDDRRRRSVLRWIGRWMGSDAGPAGSSGSATGSAAAVGSNGGRTADHTPTDAHRAFPDIPGFDILDEAGRGGMGRVYVARDLGLDKVVALKLIDAGGLDGPSVRARFEREVRAMSRIDHPNIVPVYHAAYSGGRAYFTMKYVPGGTLAKHMARVRADLRRAVRLVAVIARAVQHAHDRGILHRDLKPLNILLGDGDEPLVADFGLAKFAGDGNKELTQPGSILGTRQWMSPEQTRGKAGAYTPACDIWALGVILYEVLSGRRPFADDDPVELYRQIREQEPDSCSSTNPEAPPELEVVVRTCLAKDPKDRYETAGHVADALEAWLADGSVPPKPAPVRRWPRRAAVVAVALALLTGAAAGWVAAGKEPRRDEPTDHPTAVNPAAPVPIDPRPIADRLRAGETVYLIGPTGGPRVPHPPAVGADFSDRKISNYTSLTTFKTGVMELCGEDLPFPVRLEAEVAFDSAFPNAVGGVYAGGRPLPGAVPRTAAVLVIVQNRGANDAGPFHPEGLAQLCVWHGLPIRTKTQRCGGHTYPAQPAGSELHWCSLGAVLDRREIRPDFAGVPTGPIPADAMSDLVRGVIPKEAEAGVPDFGPGIGLFVTAGEVAFRNVRLTPMKP